MPRSTSIIIGEFGTVIDPIQYQTNRTDNLTIKDAVVVTAPSRAFTRAVADGMDLTENVSAQDINGATAWARNPSNQLMNLSDAVTVAKQTATQTGSNAQLLGFYYGGPPGDLTAQTAFGRVPDIASTYYQPTQQGSYGNEAARIRRGTASLTTMNTKGTNRLVGIANGVAADLAWMQQIVDGLNTVSRIDLSIPVYATLDHEWEVKVNQNGWSQGAGVMTPGTPTDPLIFGEALSVFFETLKRDAPLVKYGYWVGGSDTTKINQVMNAIRIPPLWLSTDPYTTFGDPPTNRIPNEWPARINFFKNHPKYVPWGSPPIGISEYGIDTRHGDANATAYYTGGRAFLAQYDLEFSVIFSRDRQDTPTSFVEYDFIGGTNILPNAQAAFAASLAAPRQTTALNLSTSVTSLGDPDLGSAINQVGGVVRSHGNIGQYIAVNSAGNTPQIHYWDTTAPAGLNASYTVGGVTNTDWEDAGQGPGPVAGTNYLFVGDLGLNGAPKIYRFPEPTVAVNQAFVSGTIAAGTVDTISFTYPAGWVESRAMFVDPVTGDLFLFQTRTIPSTTVPQRPQTVQFAKIPASQFAAAGNHAVTPTVMGSVRAFDQTVSSIGPTSADISIDGSYILLSNYEEVWVWKRSGGVSVESTLLNSPIGPNHVWFDGSDAAHQWGAEGVAFNYQANPDRIYGLAQGTTSSLKFITMTVA